VAKTIFYWKILVLNVPTRVETKMYFSVFAKMRKWSDFRKISFRENEKPIFAKM
jgi:hypothetical protein